MVPDVDYCDAHIKTMIAKNKVMDANGYPHSVLLQNPKVFWAATDWCDNTLKKENVTWSGQQFWFKKEEDQLLFTLTWN
jgi:hypothetical protein